SGSGSGGHAEGDTLTGVEGIAGSGFGDTLRGSGNDDVVDGEAGDDRLFGHDGDDTRHGGLGADLLRGGAGSDIADYAGPSGVQIDLANGSASGGAAEGDTLTGIEGISGSAFDDTLRGSSQSDFLDGATGN